MNLDLSNIEQRQLHQAMTDIQSALVGLRQLLDDQVVRRVPANQFDELRSYLGTIGDGHYRIDQLLYNEDVREPDPLNPSTAAYRAAVDEALARIVAAQAEEISATTDHANPHGIVVSDIVAQARTWYGYNSQADRLAAQLERGLITGAEYEAAKAVLDASFDGAVKP